MFIFRTLCTIFLKISEYFKPTKIARDPRGIGLKSFLAFTINLGVTRHSRHCSHDLDFPAVKTFHDLPPPLFPPWSIDVMIKLKFLNSVMTHESDYHDCQDC